MYHNQLVIQNKWARDRNCNEVFKGYLSAISVANEKAAWNYIKETCLTALENYPTTLAEDNRVLEKDAAFGYLSVNERNCTLYRKSEKEMLELMIKSCDIVVQDLLRTTDLEELVNF